MHRFSLERRSQLYVFLRPRGLYLRKDIIESIGVLQRGELVAVNDDAYCYSVYFRNASGQRLRSYRLGGSN